MLMEMIPEAGYTEDAEKVSNFRPILLAKSVGDGTQRTVGL